MASEVSSSLGGLQWPQRSSATSVVGSSLGGCQRPRRSAVALEVISDLNFELSGLNNLCFNTSLPSILLYSTNVPRRRRRRTKLTCRLALLRMLVKICKRGRRQRGGQLSRGNHRTSKTIFRVSRPSPTTLPLLAFLFPERNYFRQRRSIAVFYRVGRLSPISILLWTGSRANRDSTRPSRRSQGVD